MKKNTNSYRIVSDSRGYYPQTLVIKTYLFGLITVRKWLRIAKHLDGFGLYDDLIYSLDNITRCELLIQSYHQETLKKNKTLNKPIKVVKYITINQ